MIEIPLTQGKVALIDDEDYGLVSQYKWCASKSRGVWYAMANIRINGKYCHVKMHRLILGLCVGEGKNVDHIDHNTLDNRRCNIRICSISQNQHNQKPRKATSRFKGVHWHKRNKKWAASLHIISRRIYLGYFSAEVDAACAYNKAAKKYFGDFACLNPV